MYETILREREKLQNQMQILRVLATKVTDGEDKYLIQWLGNHRDSSTWHSKSQIIFHYPNQLVHLEMFDKRFNNKYSQARRSLSNIKKKTTTRLVCKDVLQGNNHSSPEKKVNQLIDQTQKDDVKKDSIILRHGNDKALTKVKSMMEKQECSRTIRSDNLKLIISTSSKQQSHWAYNDQIKQIMEKKSGLPIYSILWSDGKQAEVNEFDLIQRESTKFCQFWENKLGLTPKKKRKE